VDPAARIVRIRQHQEDAAVDERPDHERRRLARWAPRRNGGLERTLVELTHGQETYLAPG
jgi:hypothetical protein